MGIGSCETLTMEKLIAGSIICLKCLNFHGKCFFYKVEIQKFSKLLEISFLLVMKS